MKTTLAIACAIILALLATGYVAGRFLPLWRNTIIHARPDAVVLTPAGDRLPTNRWVRRPKAYDFVDRTDWIDGAEVGRYLLENNDRNSRIRIELNGRQYWATAERAEVNPDKNRSEWWIKPAEEIRKVESDLRE